MMRAGLVSVTETRLAMPKALCWACGKFAAVLCDGVFRSHASPNSKERLCRGTYRAPSQVRW